MEVVGKDGTVVRLTVSIRVLEDDDLVARLLAGINVRVGRRAAHPEAAPRIPSHRDRFLARSGNCSSEAKRFTSKRGST